jgi:tetratricopeptide (TPR) repeat protein
MVCDSCAIMNPTVEILPTPDAAAASELAAARTAAGCIALDRDCADALLAEAALRLTEIAEARRLFAAKNSAAALPKVLAALNSDPGNADAHLLLGEISDAQPEGAARALESFQKAHALRPTDPAIGRVLALALVRAGRCREAIDQLQRVLRVQTGDLALTLELARAHEAEGNLYAAEKTLWSAVMQHDEAPEAAQAWGDFLKRRGQLGEALIWHRRAAGSGEFELPPLSVGRRHAVFLVQQGIAWPVMAPVHAAYAADPEWKVTVVAVPFRHGNLTTEAERNSVFGFLAREGIAHTHWRDFLLAPGAADVAFVPVLADETLPVGWRLDELMRAVPRIVHLAGKPGEPEAGRACDRPLHRRAWIIAVADREQRALIARGCAAGAAHVVVTDRPKDAVAARLAEEESHGSEARELVAV